MSSFLFVCLFVNQKGSTIQKLRDNLIENNQHTQINPRCCAGLWIFSAQPVKDMTVVPYLFFLNRKLETSQCCDDNSLDDLLSVVFTAYGLVY